MRSVFFNNFTNAPEQNLIEDLTIEAISIYGHDFYYCPRSVINKDDIYGEDTISEYNDGYLTTAYIKSYDSYGGDGTFLSKFNLEIRDQTTFVFAMKTFHHEVGGEQGTIRPNEGDLIYSPMMKRIFVVMYVNDKDAFFQMGALQTYTLTCEVWEYSSEKLNTGIEFIDSIEQKFSTNELKIGVSLHANGSPILDSNGNPVTTFDYEEQNQDTFADNEEFEAEGADIVEWSETSPFGEDDFQ